MSKDLKTCKNQLSGISGSILLLMSGNLFSKFLGLIREIFFAHKFGSGLISDAFFLTNSIPSTLLSAIAISVTTSFIPIFLNINNFYEKRKFVASLLNLTLILSIAECVCINLFPYQILYLFSPSLSEDTIYYSVLMLRIVSFSIFPIIIGSVFQAYAQANKIFLSTAFCGIITNIITIISYFLSSYDKFYILSVGVLCSHSFSMIFFIYCAHKAGFRYLKTFEVHNTHIKSMFFLSFPLIVARIAEDASLLVDRNIAAGLGVGMISNIGYANLLANAISSMIINSIVVAMFPSLSQMIADKDMDGFSSLFLKYAQILIILICPFAAFTCFFSDDIVGCIMIHGALQESSGRFIWECTTCYALGILPLGIQNYLIRGFYSFRETKDPMYIVLLSFICNIIMSYFSAKIFGHIGIAMSTSLSYFLSSLFLAVLFCYKYGIDLLSNLKKDFSYAILFSFSLSLCIHYFFQMVWIFNSQFIKLIIELFLFFIIYAGIIFYIKRDYFYEFISHVSHRRSV